MSQVLLQEHSLEKNKHMTRQTLTKFVFESREPDSLDDDLDRVDEFPGTFDDLDRVEEFPGLEDF